VEHTPIHDEYAKPLVPVTVDLVLMHGNSPTLFWATPMCFDDWISVSVSQGVLTPPALVNAVALGLYGQQPIKMS
jgi:hypothetical protein